MSNIAEMLKEMPIGELGNLAVEALTNGVTAGNAAQIKTALLASMNDMLKSEGADSDDLLAEPDFDLDEEEQQRLLVAAIVFNEHGNILDVEDGEDKYLFLCDAELDSHRFEKFVEDLQVIGGLR